MFSTNHQLLDRRTFKQSAGLEGDGQAPDRETLWKYRDLRTQSCRTGELFELFEDLLRTRGDQFTCVQIIDSSMVETCLTTRAFVTDQNYVHLQNLSGFSAQTRRMIEFKLFFLLFCSHRALYKPPVEFAQQIRLCYIAYIF